MNCSHRSRSEATACKFFRPIKADQVAPYHGANEFTWTLELEQDAILSSIAFGDPRPMEICDVFIPIAGVFECDPVLFAFHLEVLKNLGLIWIERGSCLCGYTDEGRAHVEAELESTGTSLALIRLHAQAQAPSIFIPGPRDLVDRMISCMAENEQRRVVEELKGMSVTGTFAKQEYVN